MRVTLKSVVILLTPAQLEAIGGCPEDFCTAAIEESLGRRPGLRSCIVHTPRDLQRKAISGIQAGRKAKGAQREQAD